MTKRALVLSGGGSKGAYEVGVMLGLKKLNIEYEIVTGTSVGALNGLFAVQKDLYQAYNLWKNISFSTVYNEDIFKKNIKSNFDIYKNYAKEIVKAGGVDISGLEENLEKLFNPSKFYGSNIDYGLVTYNLSKRKPVFLTKKDLPQEKIKDFVVASATCFPAFKPKKIGKNLYIDGGYYDNLPINLAIEMGAEEVIAVDLRAPGKRKHSNYDVDINYISPRNKIVSFLIFDKELSRQAINYGYNDTLKTFGKLDGNLFTFKKNQLKKAFKKYNKIVVKKIKKLEVEDKIVYEVVKKTFYKKVLNSEYEAFCFLIDSVGFIFELEQYEIFSIRKFNTRLKKCISKTKTAGIKNLIKNLNDKKFIKKVDKKAITKLFLVAIKNKKINSISKLIPFFPKEFLSAIYLSII